MLQKMGTEASMNVSMREANGLNKSISVRRVENGYIITVSKYGDIKRTDCGCKEPCNCTRYISENKTYISTKNPLEQKTTKEKTIEGINEIRDLIDNMNLMS